MPNRLFLFVDKVNEKVKPWSIPRIRFPQFSKQETSNFLVNVHCKIFIQKFALIFILDFFVNLIALQ